ncbi:OmpP1/FadL family transporter [Roseibium marinum]|uniref:Long-chain fatty acid transport protein n=1 Tax=Roseibium marinum TaxID=281252 RepID=A0A2S3UM76_9HYPH|nr:outer membrane protein transport protein [Roseibium marinum]POF28589.1 long-chain fatty acid transport protein [Roseibium marinum]
MPSAKKKTVLFTSTAIALSMVAGAAHAGGFALREQSAYYQGMSFAGNATTGDTISSMFWNPATLVGAGQGLTVESHSSFIAPVSDIDGTFTPGALTTLNGATTSTAPSGDVASDAWIPASYAAYRFNDQVVFGLGINAPFGLSTKPEQNWAGQYYSRSSEVFTVNVNPAVAYQVNDMFAVGIGAQLQYMQVRLKSAYAFSTTAATTEFKGEGYGFGVTAGLTFKPWESTEFGLGFRSAVANDLDGSYINPGGRFFVAGVGLVNFGGNSAGIDATVVTPETVTFSASHRVNEKIRLAGTVEWTNWSRLKTVHPSGTGTSTTNPTGLPALEFNYDDGWFFSVGGEYAWNDQVTLRAGIGYELSPIDEKIRSTRLPDNDRLWLSAGLSWAPTKHLAFDLGYSHLIPADTKIDISGNHQDYNSNVGTYKGDVDSQVNIISAALRYKF